MLTTLLRPPLVPEAKAKPDLSYLGTADVNENGLSIFVKSQLPDFVNENHPKFVTFLEAYYEWLELKSNPYGRTQFLQELSDVDDTLDEYLDYFKSKYLVNFPSTLTVTRDGDRVNDRTLIKNIREFYKSKGSEKTYQFLFRVLYDSDVELYYPKSDILKISDGRWVENKTLKLTSSNGTSNVHMATRTIVQKDPISGSVIAYANVNKVILYQEGQYEITEVFIDDIVGTFRHGTDAEVETKLADGTVLKELVYGTFASIKITDGGQDYNVGDVIKLKTQQAGSVGGEAMVTALGLNGSIKTTEVQNFGVNFRGELELEFISTSGADATGKMITKALIEYPGYFTDNSGMLSSNKKLQDGDYYQDFSYVIKSEVSLENFRTTIKKLIHPAGTKIFGDISLFASMESSLPSHSEFQAYERPVVGHYTPYMFKSTGNAKAHVNNIGNTGGGAYGPNYPHGFYPGSTARDHNWGNTGGKVIISGVGLDADTFAWGNAVTGSVSGATAEVFEWTVKGTTSGTLYLMNITGGFTKSDILTSPQGTAGVTTDVNGNAFHNGRGTVLDGGNTAHNNQSYPIGGTVGTDGYTMAVELGFGTGGFPMHDHPNVRGIYGITKTVPSHGQGGPVVNTGGTGHGASMGIVYLAQFFTMPMGYHFHSDPGESTDPYYGSTGTNHEYSQEYN